MTEEECGQIKTAHHSLLSTCLANMTFYSPPPTNLQGRWGNLMEPQSKVSSWDTGMSVLLLQYVGAKSVEIPEEIQVHSHLVKTHIKVDDIKSLNLINCLFILQISVIICTNGSFLLSYLVNVLSEKKDLIC